MEILNGVVVLMLAVACVIVTVQLNEIKRLRGLVQIERHSAREWQGT
jgi:hypothetical protein